MSTALMILGFIWHILSGEAFSLYKAHKLEVALNDQNKIAADSDATVDKLFAGDVIRK